MGRTYGLALGAYWGQSCVTMPGFEIGRRRSMRRRCCSKTPNSTERVMGRKIKDLTGQRFGMLTAIKLHGVENRRATWYLACDCGKVTIAIGADVTSGNTTSCGCRNRVASTTHGLCGHPLYNIWNGVVQRTSNPNSLNYVAYGAIGRDLCPEWRDVAIFIAYVEMVLGPRPSPDHSIDRIDNERGYWPGNIRWATKREQNLNRY